MFKECAFGSVIAIAAIGLGGNTDDVRNVVKPKGQVKGLNAHETHASASLLGQFRTSTTGWLWVRTDLYLHNGVQMRPLSEAELKAGQKGVGSSDNQDNAIHDDNVIVTVIPTADRDFRGIFGDVHRATKAFKNMNNHSHNKPEQSLPLFRLMTWIDPNFVPGWTTGAAVLAMQHDKAAYHKAIEFLDEGLVHNPKSFSILNQKGFTLLARLGERNKSQVIFERGIDFSKKTDLTKIEEDEIESLENLYRWLVLVYRDKGMFDEMYALAKEGLIKFPEDVTLRRALNPPPMPLLPHARAKYAAGLNMDALAKDEVDKVDFVAEAEEHKHHDHDDH